MEMQTTFKQYIMFELKEIKSKCAHWMQCAPLISNTVYIFKYLRRESTTERNTKRKTSQQYCRWQPLKNGKQVKRDTASWCARPSSVVYCGLLTDHPGGAGPICTPCPPKRLWPLPKTCSRPLSPLIFYWPHLKHHDLSRLVPANCFLQGL